MKTPGAIAIGRVALIATVTANVLLPEIAYAQSAQQQINELRGLIQQQQNTIGQLQRRLETLRGVTNARDRRKRTAASAGPEEACDRQTVYRFR